MATLRNLTIGLIRQAGYTGIAAASREPHCPVREIFTCSDLRQVHEVL
jgi:hypothetical protein